MHKSPIVVKIQHTLVRETHQSIHQLQEMFQKEINQTGQSIAQVIERFRKNQGVLGNDRVVENTLSEFIAKLNNNNDMYYYVALSEPSVTDGSTENSIQHTENILEAVQKQYSEDQKTIEKPFEQQMDDVPEIPYDQMAFVNHMHSAVDNEIEDMDNYHKVMNTLWQIFCVGGWSQVDAGYLECVDRFREEYQPKCDTSLLKIGSSVRLMNGETRIVENFMWMEPDDSQHQAYTLLVKFHEFNSSVTYTADGRYDMDEKYNLLNMTSIDGKAGN